jgi:hypothetical protein
MYTTYYDRTFPADHDMNLVRRRVVEVGPSMDEHPGLGPKAYRIRDNQMSSFSPWHDLIAMAAFFFGDSGFAELVHTSGRPTVEHWPELAALTELGARPDVHTAALVADPGTWQLLRFTLWANDIPADEEGDRFKVMHLSAAGTTELRGITDVHDAV